MDCFHLNRNILYDSFSSPPLSEKTPNHNIYVMVFLKPYEGIQIILGPNFLICIKYILCIKQFDINSYHFRIENDFQRKFFKMLFY